jgi:hypothetical protein
MYSFPSHDFQKTLVLRFWERARCRPVAGYAMYLESSDRGLTLAINCRAATTADKLWRDRDRLDLAAQELGITWLQLRVQGDSWGPPWRPD